MRDEAVRLRDENNKLRQQLKDAEEKAARAASQPKLATPAAGAQVDWWEEDAKPPAPAAEARPSDPTGGGNASWELMEESLRAKDSEISNLRGKLQVRHGTVTRAHVAIASCVNRSIVARTRKYGTL